MTQLISIIVTAFMLIFIAPGNAQQYFQAAPFGRRSDGPSFAYQTPTLSGTGMPGLSSHYMPLPPPEGGIGPEYGHPSVMANAMREAELPPELLKSTRFYGEPRIAAGLSKQSWVTDQETLVTNREAEKIPREMVFKIFRNAGWIKRR